MCAMKEPQVLLPGMMCDARLFGPQIAELSAEYSIMVSPITRGERIEEIASGLLDELPARFALAGLSMGGIVAMEILRRAPDRVTRLCLMDTNPLAETPPVAAAREPQIVKVRAGRLREIMRDEMKPNYLAPGPYRTEILELVMDMADALGPDVFVRQSRALQRRRDQQGTLRKCRVPTLVLCGEHDALCPVKRHTFMAELIHGAQLRVIADAGHLPTLETPAETTQALRDWLRQPLILR
jgi:pimeloyl-ACP methyl ester carboxylesterase